MAIERQSVASRNTLVDAWTALLNGGSLEWRTTALPATPAAADKGVLLATNTCAATSFAASVAGSAIYNADTANIQVATGNIGHCRIKDSGGAVVCDLDVTVTAGGGAIEVDKLAVATGEKVTVTSFARSEAM